MVLFRTASHVISDLYCVAPLGVCRLPLVARPAPNGISKHGHLHSLKNTHRPSLRMALPDPASIASSLRTRLPKELQRPLVAIVCGSGLAGLAEMLQDRVDVPYTDIDGFKVSTGNGELGFAASGCISAHTCVYADSGHFPSWGRLARVRIHSGWAQVKAILRQAWWSDRCRSSWALPHVRGVSALARHSADKGLSRSWVQGRYQ